MQMKRHPIRFFLVLFGTPAVLATAVLALIFDWPWGIAWLVAVNFSALALWGFDKWQARRRGWRVPEMALHIVALAGATPAAFIGMKIFRHKTLKPMFVVIYAIFFLFQAALIFTISGR